MKTIKYTVALVGILSMFLLSGCSTLTTMIPDEVKYGQLYTLEEVMVTASQQCDDESSRAIANDWAKQVSGSLGEHVSYLDEESSAYIEAKLLLKDLSKIRGNSGTDNCKNYQVVAMRSQGLVVALTATAPGASMLASR
ncbi:MAG: hypothetical protein OEL79_02375 [Chromatiales bacterium]|nr:hypothetical protein [Chromatiales bacterium]